MHAENIDARAMFGFLWSEKRQFFRFLKWTEEMRRDRKSLHA